MLGSIDLSGCITSEIKYNGGYWKIDQTNAISLVTSARKDKASGMSVEFQVTFDTEAAASEFLAYCHQHSADNPDFDEEEGAGIAFYIRSDGWHYTVWSVTATKSVIGESPLDYIQYCYDVVCQLVSPYAEGTAQEFDEDDYISSIISSMSEMCINKNGDIYVLGSTGVLWTFSIANGFTLFPIQCGSKLVRISANDSYIMGIDENGAMHRYNGSAWEAFMASDIAYDISIADDGTVYRIGPYTGTSYDPAYDSLFKLVGGAWTRLGYPYSKCAAKDTDVVWAIHKTTLATWEFEFGTPSLISNTAMSEISQFYNGAVDGITSAGNAVHWNTVYGWQSRSKSVIAVASSGYYKAYYIALDGSGLWEYATQWINLGQDIVCRQLTFSLDNSDGQLPESPDIAIDCVGGEDLTLSIADSETIVLADQINSEEQWSFEGGKKRIVETYVGDVSSLNAWLLDWDWTAAPDAPPVWSGGEIWLDSGRDSFILLSGPNKIIAPIKMTANLSLTAGGATNEAYVQISSDKSNWKTVFDQIRFESGEAVYGIPEAMGMKDCYVRLYCNSGTATRYLKIASIKFEVIRAAIPLPVVPAGKNKTATISITDGEMEMFGSFAPVGKL
jgi:hypothetical protein